MAKKARIITTAYVDGKEYAPNQVVEFDDKMAKALKEQGSADLDPTAVAYCIEQLGATVVQHAPADGGSADAPAAAS